LYDGCGSGKAARHSSSSSGTDGRGIRYDQCLAGDFRCLAQVNFRETLHEYFILLGLLAVVFAMGDSFGKLVIFKI
jgi:hypothetical protein